MKKDFSIFAFPFEKKSTNFVDKKMIMIWVDKLIQNIKIFILEQVFGKNQYLRWIT